MRRLRELNQYRDRQWERMMGGEGNDLGGCFRVKIRPGVELSVIAASGEGWDHVSVSTPHRCPSWDEMEHIKRLFFNDNEVAMQLHVPPTDHISVHPHCLHIWRPHGVDIPLPPKGMVA
jgi:hypothetical protein